MSEEKNNTPENGGKSEEDIFKGGAELKPSEAGPNEDIHEEVPGQKQEDQSTTPQSAEQPPSKSVKARVVQPEDAETMDKASTDKDPAVKPETEAEAMNPDEEAGLPAGETGKKLEAAGIPVRHLGADAGGMETIAFEREDAVKGAEFLRDECRFDLLLSCAGVDWKDHRESVYHVYSTKTHQYLAFKIQADEDEHSPSMMPVWHAADWHERETYDLMGIVYDGHANLSRILMPSDWIGYPLRKDYKVDDPRLVWNER